MTDDVRLTDEALEWAVSKWRDEVANRPLQNVHRSALDTTWRQVIRRFGGDDQMLVGPTHDELVNTPEGRALFASRAAAAPPASRADDLRAAVAEMQFPNNDKTGPGAALQGGWMLAIKAVLDLIDTRAALAPPPDAEGGAM